MEEILAWFDDIPNALVVLITGVVAIIGWFLRGRLQHSQHRNQHTFDALRDASSEPDFQVSQAAIHRYLKKDRNLPNFYEIKNNVSKNKNLRRAVSFLLNHYEFLAAGIRAGNISERLLRNSEQGIIVNLFETSVDYINSRREEMDSDKIYEHIEWLHNRWADNPPGEMQKFLELIWGKPLWDRPFYHNYGFWAFLFTCTIPVLAALLGRLVN